MPDILIFDVNETLLDLQDLKPHFESTFGDAIVMGEWFGLMLRYSLVATVTRRYFSFDVLGKDALAIIAEKHSVELSASQIDTIVGAMQTLPPHPDVVPALSKLQEAGFRMATLTNSPPSVIAAQLVNAGLTHFFEKQLSVDTVQLFKPAPETYQYAASQFEVSIKEIRLVAAHDWDVSGAIQAGAKAAFVARKGMFPAKSAALPKIVGPNLLDVAAQLITETI